MQKDPEQNNNLYGNSDYAEAVSELEGTTESTEVYKSLYGEQWKPESQIRPAFRENAE